MTTRIAIFGDLHGNSAATARTLRAIDAAQPDVDYCLGDLVGYGARPNETIDLVRERAIPAVMGNYDDGVGFDRDERSLERIAAGADGDVLVFGHTHVPWSRRIGEVLFVNAGGVGKPKDGDPRACWVSLTLPAGREPDVAYHRVPYDIEVMADAIRAVDGLPEQFARDLETAGEHD